MTDNAHMNTTYSDIQNRANTAINAARDSFWTTLRQQYPEITTGDLSPEMSVEFEDATARAAKEWIAHNAPMTAERGIYFGDRPNDWWICESVPVYDAEGRFIGRKGTLLEEGFVTEQDALDRIAVISARRAQGESQ